MRVKPAAPAALTAVLLAAAAALHAGRDHPLEIALWGLISAAAAASGFLVARRLPANPIGWLLLFIGAWTALGMTGRGWGLFAADHDLPGGALGSWLDSWSWQVTLVAWAMLLLIFPGGRPPTGRWRVVPWLAGVSLPFTFVGEALSTRIDPDFAGGQNPFAVGGAELEPVFALGALLLVLAFGLALASLVTRFRHAHPLERRQVKVIALAAGAALFVAPFAVFLWYESVIVQVAVGVVFAALPASVCVAILRYRLYDIDVVVNRTLVYGGLTLSLAAAYGATALLLGTALGSGSTLATAGATLMAAVAFFPLRRRLQDAVDRRFDRAGYDALGRVASFMEDLRAGKAEPDGIEGLLAEVLRDPELELRFFMPASELYVDRHGEPVVKADADVRERLHIARAGAPVGIMLYDARRQEDPGLAARVAAAATLPVEIARLHVELQRQLDEVKASRARIVAAGDQERRRIERNLHDGAQQRLVSVGLALRHMQSGLDPASSEAVDDTVEEISAVIGELRELARGLRPAQLDHGLAPALAELAGRSPLAVKVEAPPERFPEAVEAAGYFIACEGLTNAIKHAGASSVVISVARSNGSLLVSVADDGVGGARPGEGSGLRGVRDRAVAHGGRLEVRSEPGSGTRLTAELPCA